MHSIATTLLPSGPLVEGVSVTAASRISGERSPAPSLASASSGPTAMERKKQDVKTKVMKIMIEKYGRESI